MTPPKILPPHYFVLSLLLIVAIGWFEGGSLLPIPWPYLGTIPIILGVLIAAQGSRLFAKAGTSIIPLSESSALVTSGVFSFSRNPMYSGMLLALTGTATIMNGITPWLLVVAFFAVIRGFFISKEEILMEQTFGEEYIAYKGSVRRWI